MRVLDYGNYAVETGHFVQTFTRPGSPPYDYAGKYMVCVASRADSRGSCRNCGAPTRP
jgi:hypothetical protein